MRRAQEKGDLTLSQTTSFRTFQTERVCRRQFLNFIKMSGSSLNRLKTLWEKEKLLTENAVGKGEIAHYEQFLLFPQCFQRTYTAYT